MLTVGVQTGGAEKYLGIDGTYRVIREAGFDAADAGFHAFLTYQQVKNYEIPAAFTGTEADFLALCRPYKEAAERYGLFHSQVHTPFPIYHPLKNDPEYDEFLMKTQLWSIHACDSIGCRNAVVHPAFHNYPEDLDKETEWEINMERYARLIPAAREYGVTVCLENMFCSRPIPGRPPKKYIACCSDAAEAVRYVDALNDLAGEERFAFCFDVGHAHLIGRDVEKDMKTLGKRIRLLHIHDNDGTRDAHLAPYMGSLDWDGFVRGLRAIGYQGTLSFETLGIWNEIDPELCPSVMRTICDAGRLFARRAEG